MISTWALLFGIVYSLQEELFEKSSFNSHAQIQSSLTGWLIVGFTVSLAVFTSRLALQKERPRWLEILFWIPILPLAAYILAQFCVHWYLIAAAPSVLLLILGSAVPIATLLWGAFQLRYSNRRRVFSEILNLTGAAFFLTIVSLCWIGITRYMARELIKKAEARWVEIGHSMTDYKARLYRTEENEAFKLLMAKVSPLGIGSLYKRKEGELNLNSGQANAAGEIAYLSMAMPPADEVPAPQVALVDSTVCRNELNQLYRSILENPAPVWSINEAEGSEMRVPNFLALRKLSQLVVGDSLQRLHENDMESAMLASSSILLANKNTREQPLLVSVMINCAIEALFAKITARLPEDPKAWDLLAGKAEAFRNGLKRAIQCEAWQIGNLKGNPEIFYGNGSPNEDRKAAVSHILIRTFQRLNGTLYRQIGEASLMEAEMVHILETEKNYARGDLGAKAISELLDQYPDNSFAPNIIRSIKRLNSMLILLEQAEMIRFARARMKEGVLEAKHASVVVPGLTWEMKGDLETHSALIKLSSVPEWLADNDVTGDGFYLLPFDGSKAWTCRN
ncbi:MAG: hypothetical protein JWL59_3287 [Chthoniobacteraceae bacterium]|nr:hypothetical protein [Chthoniobacteraceae bacterium]